MEGLLIVLVAGAILVLVPVVMVAVLFRVLVGLALLPFKLAGAALKLLAGIAGFVAAVLGAVLAVLAALAACLVALLVLPLLPFLLLAGMFWLLVKILEPRPVVRVS